jgi:hypothetical protein
VWSHALKIDHSIGFVDRDFSGWLLKSVAAPPAERKPASVPFAMDAESSPGNDVVLVGDSGSL